MRTRFPFKKKIKLLQAKHPELPNHSPEESKPFSDNFSDNLKFFQENFQDCSDVVFRKFKVGAQEAFLIFVDGIVKSQEIEDSVLRPLINNFKDIHDSSMETIEKELLTIAQLSVVEKLDEAVDAVLGGNALLFIEGNSTGFNINARGGTRRSVQEPVTEASIRGPREGFTENISTNTGLLRFKIKSPHLKAIPYTIGTETKTSVALFYMDNIADPELINEVKQRIKRIKIDGILESGYIEELIEDAPYSPFPQMHYTERPDTAAAQLLEGRFAIFVDGTPFVLIGPVTFWQMMQASEDYYERYWISNLIRLLRYFFLFIALFLPSLYIAITTYHQDMLPTTLMLSIAAAREAIPFPAIVEALIMEISFEALREASIRLPKTIGQAVSILGALVVGQASVQAGIVSASVVIIVSLTGIASFSIPRFNFAISIRMIRFPIMFFAAVFGLFGILIGAVLIAAHLCRLKSFGTPYLSGVTPYRPSEMKDIFIRTPWWNMLKRPPSYVGQNRQRMDQDMKPKPKTGG